MTLKHIGIVSMSAHVQFAVSQTHLHCHKLYTTQMHMFAVLLISSTVGFLIPGDTSVKNKVPKKVLWFTWLQHALPKTGAWPARATLQMPARLCMLRSLLLQPQ